MQEKSQMQTIARMVFAFNLPDKMQCFDRIIRVIRHFFCSVTKSLPRYVAGIPAKIYVSPQNPYGWVKSAGQSREISPDLVFAARKSGAVETAPLIWFCSYTREKMMDATVPSIIMIATIRLKILRPLLIVSHLLYYLPTDA
jgi:hypothetical protein